VPALRPRTLRSSCGLNVLPPTAAGKIVGDLLERAPGAIAAAREETEGVPDDLAATIERRLAQLRAPA